MPGAPGSFAHDTYLSPFTWRYGSEPMRRLWSEEHKRGLWRRVWVALAAAEADASLVSAEQLADLRAHQDNLDMARSAVIEAEIHHDLMAELRCFAEQCDTGGGILHLGATSADIEDNADALRLRQALQLIGERLDYLLTVLAGQIESHAALVCMGYTHLQPAEPTTVGYRLAGYAQDLLASRSEWAQAIQAVRGKGFKGAVGTAASYAQLLAGTGTTPVQLEAAAMRSLDLPFFPVTGQTYPRRQDWLVINVLAGLAMTVYRLAFDLRLLQSPLFGEWSEPFGAAQVGSSAMPFKRNPINAENMDSLARWLAALPGVAWGNAAHHLLERTLDDSANRRLILPEAFLAADELLGRTARVLQDLRVDEMSIRRNLATYGVFAATERVLMEGVKAGGDRQDLHEVIREHSLAAWDSVRSGQPNPLADGLSQDARIGRWLSPQRVRALLDAEDYVGDAPERARAMARNLRDQLGGSRG
jgi:adenylosuccinate lyase